MLAGCLDILPILGFFIATAPAFLLALSVSPRTAVIVLGLYLLSHAIENLKPFLRDGVSEKHELQKNEAFGDKA